MSSKSYERTKALVQQKGISWYKLSKETGIPEETFSNWKKGKYEPKNEKLNKIADYFDVSVDYLINGNEAEEIKFKIPVLGVVPCGTPIEAIEEIIEYIDVVPSMAKEHFGLIAKGDSMYPFICEGDILIVKKTSDVKSGKISIVKVNGDDATCKKIKITEDGISLIPLNNDYDVAFYTPKQVKSLPVMIIGEVVEIRRRFK